LDIDIFLAQRVHDLRKARGLTLAELAERSGVSRSMISLIERQETSPTAAVLNKLAGAFGIPLPTLFAGGAQASPPNPLARQAEQAVWTDPASGYVRRHLSPVGVALPLELVEVAFPPGETVVFDNPVRQVGFRQQMWVLAGAMAVTLDGQTWHLATGDCLALALGGHIAFHNPGTSLARYLLALVTAQDLPASHP
jgi:transcriptional regulator with XRE-family HTH domain